MKPCRAAETSATASGKRTRMASRRAIACSSGPPVASTCFSAAAVSSTAVFSVSVANCSRWASATASLCFSAKSRSPRSRSSGSPPNEKPKPPSSFMSRQGTERGSLDDHHRARRALRDAVRGRAEQVVAQEVAAASEHDEIVGPLRGDARDQLGGMTCADDDLERDTGPLRLVSRILREPLEEGILLALD